MTSPRRNGYHCATRCRNMFYNLALPQFSKECVKLKSIYKSPPYNTGQSTWRRVRQMPRYVHRVSNRTRPSRSDSTYDIASDLPTCVFCYTKISSYAGFSIKSVIMCSVILVFTGHDHRPPGLGCRTSLVFHNEACRQTGMSLSGTLHLNFHLKHLEYVRSWLQIHPHAHCKFVKNVCTVLKYMERLNIELRLNYIRLIVCLLFVY